MQRFLFFYRKQVTDRRSSHERRDYWSRTCTLNLSFPASTHAHSFQDASIADLSKKYYLTLEAIALQTRHIIESMNIAGHEINSLYLSGGQARNAVLMQLFADVCGVPVVLPASYSEAVVLGAAMLGRIAAEKVTESEQMWKIMVTLVFHDNGSQLKCSHYSRS